MSSDDRIDAINLALKLAFDHLFDEIKVIKRDIYDIKKEKIRNKKC